MTTPIPLPNNPAPPMPIQPGDLSASLGYTASGKTGNPVLDEISAAHANLSPQAQQAIEGAHGMLGISPAHSDPALISAATPAGSPAVAVPGVSGPRAPLPNLSPETPPAARPSAGPVGRPMATPVTVPTPSDAQREYSRLTAPPLPPSDPNAHTALDTGRPGSEQIHNPWARGFAALGDVVASGMFPRFGQFVPGTTAHHQMLVNNAASTVAHEQAGQKNAAEVAREQAEQEHLRAQAEELSHRSEREDAQAKALENEKGNAQILFDKAGNAIGYHDPRSAQKFYGIGDPNLPAGVKEILDSAKPKAERADIHAMYAEAVADAQKRGVKPSEDPRVQDLSEAITSLQKVPAEKIPSHDDKYIAILQKPAGERTPEEKSFVQAYKQFTNETKVQPGVMRMEVLGQTREMPVLDTKNGNTPMFLNASDINAANRKEPGRYMPAGVAAPALSKTALIEDIRGNVQQVRDSLKAMPELDLGARTKIAIAMRSRDPKSAVSALITSGAIPNDPHLQDYLINLTNLHENAMAMRSVLGAGQGSEDLRSAITAVVPGPQTPSKEYAGKQLDTFEKTLDRLEKGIPKVPLRNEGAAKSYTQADVDAAIAAGHGTATQIEDAFAAKGYVKK